MLKLAPWLVAAILIGCGPSVALASQEAASPVEAGAEATAALSMFDGIWIGPARMTGRDGQVTEFEQMERIGPMLGGQIRVMEGKARDADGRTLFNAFTVFSTADEGGISMRSWTPGHEGVRTIRLTADGYIWSTDSSAGTMTYEIAVADGVWRETGVIELPGGRRVKFFEMTLTRTADVDWPAANPDFVTQD